jgi:hypothetical protein
MKWVNEMQLTPQQQEQINQAKARGEQRVTLQATAAQKAAWREAVTQELAGKDENVAQFRKIKTAAEQPGFFGDVRRAIVLSRRPVAELARVIGVEPRKLSDFRAGEAELPSAALERLVETLGLRLMQEISRLAPTVHGEFVLPFIETAQHEQEAREE